MYRPARRAYRRDHNNEADERKGLTMDATRTDRDERAGFPLMGAEIAPIAAAAETGGAYELIESTVAPGGGSPPHTLECDKVFYVLEGEITLVSAGDEHTGRAGTAVGVPAGTSHNYRNDSGAPARMLVLTSGPGHVEFLRGMSRLAAGGPPDPAAVEAHAARHGVRLIAPARAG